ncbi:MAG: type II secretion system protein [Candidatus Saccharimonadales bacterium]
MVKNQTGFTLIELVVSITLIGVVIGSTLTLFLTIQSTQRRTVYLETATRSAQRKMESLRNNNYNNLVAGQTLNFTAELPVELKNRTGSVLVSEPTPGLKRIDITVEYYEGTSRQEVKLSSLVGILGITQ